MNLDSERVAVSFIILMAIIATLLVVAFIVAMTMVNGILVPIVLITFITAWAGLYLIIAWLDER